MVVIFDVGSPPKILKLIRHKPPSDQKAIAMPEGHLPNAMTTFPINVSQSFEKKYWEIVWFEYPILVYMNGLNQWFESSSVNPEILPDGILINWLPFQLLFEGFFEGSKNNNSYRISQ